MLFSWSPLTNAQVSSNRTPFAEMFNNWLRHGAKDDSDRRLMLSRIDMILNSQNYYALLLFDVQGQVRLSMYEPKSIAEHEPEGIDERDRQLVFEAIRTRQVRIDDIHIGTAHPPAMGLVAPMLAGEGKESYVVGVLYFRIDPARFLYPLIESWPIESQTAETLLARRDGEEVLFLNRLRHLNAAPLSFRAPLATFDLPAAQALRGKKGFTRGKDYRGEKVTGYLLRIPGTDWIMVSKIDETEIYTPIHYLVFYMAMALFVLLSFGIYIFWSLRVRAEYVWQQYQTELRNRMLVQRFDYLSKFANDIIILGDDQNHFLEVNDRAIETYGYTRAEFLQMGIRELRSPKALVTQEHDWHNLMANGQTLLETVHRRKDGSSFPVEISARMISADHRQYMQAIIRDISERKRAEVTLRLHECLTNNMQEGLSLIRSSNGLIVFTNPKFDAMFGYTTDEIHGRHVSCLNAPTDDSPEENARKIMEVLNRTEMWSGEIKNIRKDGTVFWCNATVSSFVHHDYGKVWLAIHQDITERKKLEQTQIEYLERIRELGQRLLAIQEDERRKLGMELHDRTASNLATMNLLLKDLTTTNLRVG
ncbi:hypothetical protein CCP3SC1_400031 [Gammaproteobacteria bacterium]